MYGFSKAIVFLLIMAVSGIVSSCTSGQSKDVRIGPTLPSAHQNEAPTHAQPFFAGRLERFLSSDVYFVPLYFKDEATDSVFQLLEKAERTVLFTGDEERRSALNKGLVETHFVTSGLKKLILLDSFQNVVETLSLSNYEYLETNIGSSYVASYKTKHESQGYHVVSLEAFEKRPIERAPRFTSNSRLLKNVLSQNKLKPDYSYFHGLTSHENHQYMLVSFVNYTRHSNAVYLFKDGTPTDSIVQNYCLFDFKPISFVSDDRAYYTAHGGIPETDAVWDQLFEIDWRKGTLVMHHRNRFNN